MTDETIRAARERLIETRRWGRTCEIAIRSGAWDTGGMMRDAIAAVLRERQEVIPE
jgi:hypothetical protein